MYWQLWAVCVLTGCFERPLSGNHHLFFLWSSHTWLWSFSHLWAQDLSTSQCSSVILWIDDNGNNPPACVYSLTLSSALSRISLSGKAPSRGIHWSRTSCGSESSSLTGTTRDPIGWSHALDNYTGKDTLIMSVRGGDVSDTGSRLQILLVALLDRQCTRLHYEHLLTGVSNQEAERLIPLRWSGAITHLKIEKQNGWVRWGFIF